MMIRFGTTDWTQQDFEGVMSLFAEKDPQLTMGKWVRRFEEAVASWSGAKYAVMVNSGTSALIAALSAYRQSDRYYSEYIETTALTYCATWNAVRAAGFLNICRDVGEDFVTHNTLSEELEGKSRIPALSVDLFGKPCRVPCIVEDATEAMGGTLGGKKLGRLGEMGCYSFHVTHVLTTIEGGMVITDNPKLHEAVRHIRDNGKICSCPVCTFKTQGKCIHNRGEMEWERRFETDYSGFGFKPIEVQGLLGCLRMKRIEVITKRRREIFKMYEEAIGSLKEESDEEIVTICYPAKTKNPMRVVGKMEAEGIECRGMFPPFSSMDKVANQLAKSHLLLPLHQGMTDENVKFVIEKFKELKE